MPAKTPAPHIELANLAHQSWRFPFPVDEKTEAIALAAKRAGDLQCSVGTRAWAGTDRRVCEVVLGDRDGTAVDPGALQPRTVLPPEVWTALKEAPMTYALLMGLADPKGEGIPRRVTANPVGRPLLGA